MKPDEVVYRVLQRLPARMLSLRSIVILAALAVVALVVTLGVWVWVGVTNDQYSQLDRRLDSVSSLGDFSTLLSGPPTPGAASPDGNLVRTVRVGSMAMSSPTSVVLPKFADGYANTTIDGVEYRVRTFTVGGASIALGAPLAETQRRISELHWRVLLICGGVIAGTVVVGLVLLADHDRPVSAAGPAGPRHQRPVQARGSTGSREFGRPSRSARRWRECSPGSATSRIEPRPRWSRRGTSPPSPRMNCAHH